jgi:hypothetical protein
MQSQLATTEYFPVSTRAVSRAFEATRFEVSGQETLSHAFME